MSCVNTVNAPVKCKKGMFNNQEDKQFCTECPYGTTQLEEGQTDCDSCPVGNTCPNPHSEPVPCPAGKYNN
jgi:hypothetical protein